MTMKQNILNRVRVSLGTRSAWARGVYQYAEELMENIEDKNQLASVDTSYQRLLNGADSWYRYSEGGCALVYDGDICERLCPPSVIERYKHGRLSPCEGWIKVQERALKQAAREIVSAYRKEAR